MTTNQPTAMDRLNSLCPCGHTRRAHGTTTVVGRGQCRACEVCDDYRLAAFLHERAAAREIRQENNR